MPTRSPDAVRAVVILTERPPASVLLALHRRLGLGIAEVRRRIDDGEPLLDRELFGNDWIPLGDLVRAVLTLIEPFDHSVHECIGVSTPDEVNRIGDEQLLRLIVPDVESEAFA